MGNQIGKLCLCSAGAGAGAISGRFHNKHDKSLGDSIYYVRPDPCRRSVDDVTLMTFRSVSGATVSANSSSTASTSLDDSLQHSTVLDSSSSFESSGSFVSMTMVPRGFSVGGFVASTSDRVLNGPEKKLKRSLSNSGCEIQNNSNKHTLKKILSEAFSKNGRKSILKKNGNANARVSCSSSTSEGGESHNVEDDNYLNYDDGGGGGEIVMECQNLHWAQGRAGEDRVHIVICEDHGWVYVGIYDGFNGPDATDYLLNNMFYAVHDELKGILCSHKLESKVSTSLINSGSSELEEEVFKGKRVNLSAEEAKSEGDFGHSDVLQILSEALRKTEDAFLKHVNEMITHNPVLSMMGSCVLVVLMKGEDVYLMNVGDSPAVLATQDGNSLQLTMEHSTHVKEEVHRIRREHPDDPSAVTKGRVKGFLNVTRAFGAGFLKQPKQNNAVLEPFKVKYIGDSPYITCSPSLHHHRLSSNDKFLILSSDGLYQYLTNEEAVAKVVYFITTFPHRDPAQLLIEEALSRAAKKAGMSFHELLDIPKGERRLYHDDISVIIISLEGKLWRSLV